MRKTSMDRRPSAWDIVVMIALLVTVVVSVYLSVRFCRIESKQKQIEVQLEKALQGEVSLTYDDQSNKLADEVSTALAITSAGIAIFAIFGGTISIVSIVRFKKLEDSVSKIRKIERSQRELTSAQLIQEGLVYKMRERNKYAIESFEKAKATAPRSISALWAEYEIIALRADISKNEEELQNSCKRAESLVGELEKLNNRDAIVLKADTCFILGCVYGNRYMANSSLEHFRKSESYFQKAIQYDSSNVDFYRNLAISYALHDDVENCRNNLKVAICLAGNEPLYASLGEASRLKNLFTPSWPHLSSDIKEMLHKEYSISLD